MLCLLDIAGEQCCMSLIEKNLNKAQPLSPVVSSLMEGIPCFGVRYPGESQTLVKLEIARAP